MKKLYAKLATAAMIAASTCSLSSADYHVAKNATAASDANPGTAQRPFKTLSKAAAVVLPGDTVLIHSGVYAESISIKSSDVAGRPITFCAFADEEVTLEGADPIPLQKWEVVPNLRNVFATAIERDPGFISVDNSVVNLKVDQISQKYPRTYRRGILNDSDKYLFEYDAKAKKLLVNLGGDLPGNHTITVPTRGTAFVLGNQSRLCGIHARHYAEAAIQVVGSESIVRDCVASRSSQGIVVSGWDRHGTTLQRNTVRDIFGNGILLVDRPTQCLIEDNLVIRCTLNPANESDWLGSVKMNSASDCVFAHNVVLQGGNPQTDEGHDGSGFWGDINVTRVVYVGNTSAYNKAPGLYVEFAMGDTRAYFNTFYRNGYGISCRQSQRGEFMRNLLIENRTSGFAIWPGDEPYPTADHVFAHNLVRNCNPAIMIRTDQPNFCDYNTYWPGSNLFATAVLGPTGTPREFSELSEWTRATGHDAHSKISDAQPVDVGLDTVTFRVADSTNFSDALMMVGNGTCEYEDPVHQNVLPYFWRAGSGDGEDHTFTYAVYSGLDGGVDTLAYPNSGGTVSLQSDVPSDSTAPRFAHNGLRYLKISGQNPRQMCPQGLGFWTPSLPAKPGDVFEVSYFIRGLDVQPIGTRAMTAFAEFSNSTGQHRQRIELPTSMAGSEALKGTFEWVRLAGSIQVPERATRVRIFLGLAPAKGKLLIDDIGIKVR
jgi:hypothetical protein